MTDKRHVLVELKEKAAVMEAQSFDFLTANGHIARKRGQFVNIRIKFIDGTVFTIPRTFEPELKRMTFKLRPVRNDA